jgi:hypothetical protein
MLGVAMAAAVNSGRRPEKGDSGTVFTSYLPLVRRAGRGTAR